MARRYRYQMPVAAATYLTSRVASPSRLRPLLQVAFQMSRRRREIRHTERRRAKLLRSESCSSSISPRLDLNSIRSGRITTEEKDPVPVAAQKHAAGGDDLVSSGRDFSGFRCHPDRQ